MRCYCFIKKIEEKKAIRKENSDIEVSNFDNCLTDAMTHHQKSRLSSVVGEKVKTNIRLSSTSFEF